MKRICTLLCVLLFVASNIPAYGQENSDNSTLNQKEVARKAHSEALTRNTVQLDSLTGVMVTVQKDLNGVVDNIENITERIEDNTFFDWRAWVAWGVAILALIVSWVTYRAQTRTEDNTKKLTQNAQKDLLIELVRHLYRNFVITRAMRIKSKLSNFDYYPSEEHFQKLKIPMENLHLNSFYGEDDKYKTMHNLYLNFRNYNEEIDVAMKHITDPKILEETKEEDFDLLEFKVSYLTGRIADVLTEIWGNIKNEKGKNKKDKNKNKKGKDKNKVKIIDENIRKELQERLEDALAGKTNANNNQIVELEDNPYPLLDEEYVRNSQYGRIYTSKKDIDHFVDCFNKDVEQERMKNERGAWKIRMIKF